MPGSPRPDPTYLAFLRMMYCDLAFSPDPDVIAATGLGGIKPADVPDFIDFVQDVMDGKISNLSLQRTWSRSSADFFVDGPTARRLLIRAREMAEARSHRGRRAWMPLEQTHPPRNR